MKVIIINTSEIRGGAAIAANRLMKALKTAGVEAKMLVRDKQTGNPNVISVSNSFVKRKLNAVRFIWERLTIFLHNRFDRNNLFRVSIANTGGDISKHPLVRDADIIHLHWINQGFLSLSDLKKLMSLHKPVVWTMHDMWPCTGICHHARECDNFTRECGNCFYLHSTRQKDLSLRVFSKKQAIIKKAPVSYVCCSNWLMNRTQQSALTREKQICSIPNPIDISIYKKTDPADARKLLNLPQDKYLLLFGALNVTDKQKGIDYLIEGLISLKERIPEFHQKVELVVFGQVKSEIRDMFNVPIHSLGYLSDEKQIVSLYNAVDIFVTSSLEENLPNTIMEAMACGTPCVGFNTGGIPEMIDHKINGYVSEYKSSIDLATGIYWTIENNEILNLSDKAVEKVRMNYTYEIIAAKYLNLYKQQDER